MARKLLTAVYLAANTDATGRTPKLLVQPIGSQIQVAINNAAFVDAAGVWTELGAGAYSYEHAPSQIPAFGFIILKVKLTGILNGGAAECGVQNVVSVAEMKHVGSVVAGTLTENAFSSDLTEATGAWVDSWCQFKTGALAGQVKRVTAFANANGVLTLATGFTSAPAPGDSFEMINQ